MAMMKRRPGKETTAPAASGAKDTTAQTKAMEADTPGKKGTEAAVRRSDEDKQKSRYGKKDAA